MVHRTEKSFGDIVEAWFVKRYGGGRVHRQVYQPGPRWYVDLVVEFPFGTIYAELESRESEIRSGIAQALGYSSVDPRGGIPMVITPKGHLSGRKVERLAQSTTVVVAEFDDERGEFIMSG